jgi:hypothetical protein
MSATNGLAVSFRKRSRLIGCSVAVVFAISALFASAAGAVTPKTQTYLALGDSLAFGYSQQLFNENLTAGEPAKAFEHGYVNFYLRTLKPLENGVALVNNGCPGETTDSLIGNGSLASALGIPGEAPCKYHETEAEEQGGPPGFKFPLHHEYGGAGVSQLENALGVIAASFAGGKPVTTMTLNIGANDELHAIAKCKAEVAQEYGEKGFSNYEKNPGTEGPEKAFEECLLQHVNALFAHIIGNIDRTVYVLRNAETFEGVPGSNFKGKLIFAGSYDPYGVVFRAGEPIGPGGIYGTGTGKELLKNSIALTATLNGLEHKAITDSGSEAAEEGHEPFEGCFANPMPKFNPAGKANVNEPTRLQKWTNMANFKEDLGKHYGQEHADGPDIHPTREGYIKFAGSIAIAVKENAEKGITCEKP